MWREGMAAVKEHLSLDEFKDDNGKSSPAKIAAYVARMLTKMSHGYRFIYLDTEQQVSSCGLVRYSSSQGS